MFNRKKNKPAPLEAAQGGTSSPEGIIQKPIIVSGIGRSGTSVLLGAIAAHPQVHNGKNEKGEAPFITHFLDFLNSIDDAPYGPYVGRNYRCGDKEKDQLFVDLLRNINSPSAEGQGKPFWPAKVSLDEAEYRKLVAITGGFPLVKIYRNPISVIDSSLNFHGFSHLTFEQIARRWVKGNKDLKFFMNQEDVYVMAYERMSSSPDEAFKELFEKIGLPRSDKPAEFVKNTKINSAYKDKKKPSIEEQWSGWTSSQQEKCIEICGPLMKELGYDIPKVSAS